MSISPRPWTVSPYQPIEKLEDNLWEVNGTLPMAGGAFPRKMVIFKVPDGRLVFLNAIPMREDDQAQVERWGEPAFYVVPNGGHRLDAHAFAARYPSLKVICPAPVRAKVEEVVRVDGGLELLPPGLEWEAMPVKGDEPLFLSRSGGRLSLAFTDTLMNLPPLPGVAGLVLKLLGSVGGPKVTVIAKLMLVKDKEALRRKLRALSELPGLARLIPGHGADEVADAPGVLRRAADAL